MAEQAEPAADNGRTGEEDPSAAAGTAAPKARNRRVGRILAVVAVVVLAAIAYWYVNYETRGKYYQSTDDAYIQSDAVIVSSKVAGYVEQVLVAENQPVRAGQALLQIDPRDYRAQAAQFQAQIDVTRANAQGVHAQISEQQAAVGQAQAQLAGAQSTLAFARSEVARYTPLAATGAETREHLAQLRNQARDAAAQVASARAAFVAAQRRIGTLNTQVGQALSQGKAAQAQLAAANVNLASTLVRASIDGRIGNKTVQPGQFVQPGIRLMSIVPVRRLYITANFKETQLALMRVGQAATIKVDALGGIKLAGRVESFSPGTGAQFSLLPPQNATGNFTKIVQRVPVRVSIEADADAQRLLLPGMSVSVTVDTIAARDDMKRIEREEEGRRQAAK
jgi:membrane fusion protein (multidrug efflux system)